MYYLVLTLAAFANLIWFVFLCWFIWTTIERLDRLEDQVLELIKANGPSGTPADVDERHDEQLTPEGYRK